MAQSSRKWLESAVCPIRVTNDVLTTASAAADAQAQTDRTPTACIKRAAIAPCRT